MLGITLDLYGTTVVGLCQQAGRHAAERHCSRKKPGLTGKHVFRCLYIGDDLLVRLYHAPRHAGESEGRSHYLHEITAADAVVPSLYLMRVLLRNEVAKLGRVGVF